MENKKPLTEEFDLTDIQFFMNLTSEEKLNYLENLIKSLDDITPPEAKKMQEKLRDSGF